MDRETAVEIERLKAGQDALNKTVNTLEEESKSWKLLVRNTVLKSVTWLLGMGVIGVVYGWHLPNEMRKAFIDWISK
jgi:hypothetical protein